MTHRTPFILATGNRDKLKEIREILAGFPFEIRTLRDAGFSGTIEENGTTFEENALIKARAVHAVTGGYVMADDSGLAVDALGGAPGIYSARFAGEQAGYPEKIALLWSMLRDVDPDRWDASFHCAVAVCRPDGSCFTTHGECRGRILRDMRGSNGFGYDPVFYVPAFGCTTAEMDPAQKHAISHRGLALRAMAERLRQETGVHA
ncbi:MAG: RdgB/HAM1 family non-canonical purine NTP pyrophosphatase [Clostridia bacterium]|nr:RdgB/HAM1 family non-canonical purine NTP pyrophosphatase [Clostridia bacterium]